MAKRGRFLNLMRPLLGFIPTVEPPSRKITLKEKLAWTFLCLLVFLLCCQIPLFGIVHTKSSDPFYWMRVILASNKGTVMELGISPIITSSMMMQLLAGAKIIDVNMSLSEDRNLFNAAQKFFGLLITFGEATAYVLSGAYGNPQTLGLLTCSIVIAQLVTAGVVVLLLDELMQKGYGLGAGISLFLATNICENVIWKCLSPTTISSSKGTEFEGCLIALVHSLFTRKNKFAALRDAFYRSNAPNLSSLLATVIVFFLVIYFMGFRVDIPLQNQKVRGYSGSFPVRLFYTSNFPVILQTALISNVYFVSQLLYRRFSDSPLVNLLGRWQGVESKNSFSLPIGGLAFYLSPPQSLKAIADDPIHCFIYTTFMIISCGLFSKLWLEVSGSSPKDVAKSLRDQDLIIKGYRDVGIITVLNRYIPVAALFGGMCIGALTMCADMMGAIGSGTGVLLAVTIIYQYYEKVQNEFRKGEYLSA